MSTTIAGEIQRIADAVSDAWYEVGQKGGTIPANAHVDDLAAAIAGIQTGTNTTETTNPITAGDVKDGKIGFVNGQKVTGSFASQTKSVTPTTSSQSVTPDSGKWLSQVSVGAIQTQTKTATPSTSAQDITPDSGKYLSKVTVSAVQTQTKSVTPSASSQNVAPDSGKFLSQVTVNGDADLIAANIKDTVAIFGVPGAFSGPTKVAHGTETFSENVTTSNYTSHRVDTGITNPKFVCFAPNSYSSTNISKDSSKHKMLQSWWIDSAWNNRDVSGSAGSSAKAALLTTGGTVRVASSSTCWKPVSGTSYIEFSCTDSGYVWPSGTWHWIVLY